MVSLEVAAILLSGIGISASLVYYANVLRNTNKQRMTQLAMNLSNILISPENSINSIKLLSYKWDDFEDFRRKYDSTANPEQFSIRWNQWRLYDHLSYMLHLGLVDVESLYHIIGGYNILSLWEKFETIILEQRRFYEEPDWFIWLEHLAQEISKYRVKRGLPKNLANPDVYPKEF